VLVPTVAAHATDLYSPGLPATGTQFLECRIMNVTNAAQTVSSQGFDSTGTAATSAYTETLEPGQAGGFSVPAVASVTYCKFTVKGSANGFRASIDVLDTTQTPPVIAVALPAY
jgi:hypothetical protein